VRNHFTGGIYPHSFLLIMINKDVVALINYLGIKLIYAKQQHAPRETSKKYTNYFLTDKKIWGWVILYIKK